ncbi:FkbM family methyltransferase [Aurantimicrobium sp. MWH-Uga1]|uniref:FkbM family methyltransferase n=1 Tax=Aurantimicrobium sp. MWH-Uga1 TaxID=2079575 RepID=UPI000DF0A800|nr:FkbM family methyltransferase [Aurantimicrobium sp. MWH-Uga1]AXE54892.1 hypothetical protein AURUGA1_01215 [Aurantimicrobium sp. MWH-Uga1]
MISYAQNFEDVILARALSTVERGFYVDIGAWSPHIDSVTKYFYDSGWRGVNVEPNPQAFAEFLSSRVEDINRCIAISDEPGFSTLKILDNSGLSTLDESVAQTHGSSGIGYTEIQVECETLSQLFSSIENILEIHFLKVDVEGYESKVLSGNDWNRFRPWIVLIEATYPMTQIDTYFESEQILLQNDYLFVYEDGLNRFYLDRRHKDLLDLFRFPPNIFDGFIRQSEFSCQERLAIHEQSIENLKTELDNLQKLNEELNIKLQSEKNSSFVLQEVLQSNSWRWTLPLRKLSNLFKSLKRGR